MNQVLGTRIFGLPGGVAAGLSAFALLLSGCGGGDGELRGGGGPSRGSGRAPTPESQAADAAYNERVTGWEDEVRETAGNHHSAQRELTFGLRRVLESTIRQFPDAGETPRFRALKEELHAFVKDEWSLPTNPLTLQAARSYVEERLRTEHEFLAAFDDLRDRMPESRRPREVSMHVTRRLDEVTAGAQEAITRLEAAQGRLAAIDPTAPWPPDSTAVAMNDPVEPSATKPVQPEPARPAPPVSPPSRTETPPAQADPKPAVVADPGRPASPSTHATPTPKPEAKKVFLGPAPGGWAVQVDPGPETPAFPAQLDYKIPADPHSVIYPAGTFGYAAVGKSSGWVEGLTVYDLRTGKVAGRAGGFRIRIEPTRAIGPALSPDGTYLALYDSGQEAIFVGNVKTQKPVASLAWTDSRPAILFPTSDRVLAILPGGDAPAKVWKLPSGELERSFRVAEDPTPESGRLACSPGGRYLALAAEGSQPETVYFYDLTTGSEVGSLRPPGRGATVAPKFQAMAFSPDGTEFAAFIGSFKTGAFSLGEAMMVWDVATGRLVYQRVLDRGGRGMLSSLAPEPLQWFPDGQGWLLFQKFVVDRKGARVVQGVDAGGDRFAYFGTKVLDDRRVLRSVGGSALQPSDVRRAAGD